MTVISTVLLDFGGTLDSRGLHWSTQFARSFRACGVACDRRVLDHAFLRSDHRIDQISTVDKLDFESYVGLQAGFIVEDLGLPSAVAANAASAFVAAAAPHLARSRALLERYRDRFRFGLVSNFSPSLMVILDRSGLAPLFSAVVVSAVVGCRKPERRIFELALDALGATKEETGMIGDSLRNDVTAAKNVGLTTVWLHGDEDFGGGDPSAADHETDDLADALGWLAERGRGA